MSTVRQMLERFRNAPPTRRSVRNQQRRQGTLLQMWFINAEEEEKLCEEEEAEEEEEGRSVGASPTSSSTSSAGAPENEYTEARKGETNVPSVAVPTTATLAEVGQDLQALLQSFRQQHPHACTAPDARKDNTTEALVASQLPPPLLYVQSASKCAPFTPCCSLPRLYHSHTPQLLASGLPLHHCGLGCEHGLLPVADGVGGGERQNGEAGAFGPALAASRRRQRSRRRG